MLPVSLQLTISENIRPKAVTATPTRMLAKLKFPKLFWVAGPKVSRRRRKLRYRIGVDRCEQQRNALASYVVEFKFPQVNHKVFPNSHLSALFSKREFKQWQHRPANQQARKR